MKQINFTPKQTAELKKISSYFLEAAAIIDDIELRARVSVKISSRVSCLADRLIEKEKTATKALACARDYGQIDGGHHKMWVIDQMCRHILGDDYDEFVTKAKVGEDGPETYDWDTGIAP